MTLAGFYSLEVSLGIGNVDRDCPGVILLPDDGDHAIADCQAGNLFGFFDCVLMISRCRRLHDRRRDLAFGHSVFASPFHGAQGLLIERLGRISYGRKYAILADCIPREGQPITCLSFVPFTVVRLGESSLIWAFRKELSLHLVERDS